MSCLRWIWVVEERSQSKGIVPCHPFHFLPRLTLGFPPAKEVRRCTSWSFLRLSPFWWFPELTLSPYSYFPVVHFPSSTPFPLSLFFPLFFPFSILFLSFFFLSYLGISASLPSTLLFACLFLNHPPSLVSWDIRTSSPFVYRCRLRHILLPTDLTHSRFDPLPRSTHPYFGREQQPVARRFPKATK